MLNLLLVWFLVLPVAVAPAPEKEGMCPAGQCSGDASGGGAELVSVVTPTRAKTHGWHPLLYECFKRQDYQPKFCLPGSTLLHPHARGRISPKAWIRS
jgi:hypothetical protein